MSIFKTFETAWCPGCGNFAILDCLKKALEELDKDPNEVLIVAGIGQAAKTPQYIGANTFCGLHGRALPPAQAAKIANEKLTVIVNTGDGDSYGEGGNHFIHAIRRNVDITHFVHDNRIYGLTKGQASPTSNEGQVTDIQVKGSHNESFNPVLMAISAGAGFVARGYSGEKEHLVQIMKQAIQFEGYALVDILQPCVSFNKINNYEYYSSRVQKLGEDYDRHNKLGAIAKALEPETSIPIGVIYEQQKKTFHQKNEVLMKGKVLVRDDVNFEMLEKYINELK